MKKETLILLMLILWLLPLKSDAQETLQEKKPVYLADPTIFLHDDIYYLYGTTSGSKAATAEGFRVFTSTDLENWKGPMGAHDGWALRKEDVFGTKGFWAPQVFPFNDKFYMAYTANEHISIAMSDSPLGPFSNSGTKIRAKVRQIDPFIFFDDNGKKYLYHVRLQDGNRIFVAELNDELTAIKEETLTECVVAEELWENTQKATWSVAEGPTVVKQGDLYFLFYSANDFRNPDYAVGVATSRSPLGPWKKFKENPVIDENIGGIGTGHGDVLKTKDEELIYVLHTHNSGRAVRPRRVGAIKLKVSQNSEGNPEIEVEPKSFRYLTKIDQIRY